MISFPYSRDYDPPAPFAEITVGQKETVRITAFIDSGADATMIPLEVLLAVDALFVEPKFLRGITDYRRIVNIYRVNITIDGLDIPAIPVVALEDYSEPILGRDVLNQLIVTLDGIGGVTEIS